MEIFLLWLFILLPFIILIVGAIKIHFDNKKISRELEKSRKEQAMKAAKQREENDKREKQEREQIDKKIDDIVKYIGIAKPVSSKIIDQVLDDKLKTAIMMIAEQLKLTGLDITVKRCDRTKSSNNEGQTILAEVNVANVGQYGTTSFKSRPCHITVYPGYDKSLDSFISVIAHEMCHIVLHSLRPPYENQNDEEQATDLAVIFSGFKNNYKLGRVGVNSRTGYLNDNEADYAIKQYEKMLEASTAHYRCAQDNFNDIIQKYDTTMRFVSMIAKLLDNKTVKIDETDFPSINACLVAISCEQAQKLLKTHDKIKQALSTNRYAIGEDLVVDIDRFNNDLRNITLPENEHISILARYVS